jgi:prevent-host-death family protein
MEVKVSDAKGRLTDLVRRAESGEEVILTRHGRPAVRLVPIPPPVDREERWRRIDAIVESARSVALPGPCAARSADFLYDDKGLPG